MYIYEMALEDGQQGEKDNLPDAGVA
jgi:hypothetical protein